MVDLAFLGRPDFLVQRSPKPSKISILGTVDWKSGRPPNHDGSNPPYSALWVEKKVKLSGDLTSTTLGGQERRALAPHSHFESWARAQAYCKRGVEEQRELEQFRDNSHTLRLWKIVHLPKSFNTPKETREISKHIYMGPHLKVSLKRL